MHAVNKLGVVGAGQMGQGIAQVAAQSGLDVIIVDAVPDLAQAGIGKIKKQLDRLVEKAKLDAAVRDQTVARLTPGTAHRDLAGCDVVIEAAPEREELKLAIFKSLGEVCKDEAILASNTSSISITKIATASGRPDRVIGMHFMNPVPVMKLVEVIRGNDTSDDTCRQTMDLARELQKIPVEVNDYPGFVSNRVLMPMINEAAFALMEGVASKEAIDEVMKLGMNHPMGPLALADFIGLDVCLQILEVLQQGFGDPRYRPCPLLRRLVDAGHLGRKSGRGFYAYPPA